MPDCARLTLTADQLLARAREITGIDLPDDDAVEPMGLLCRAYNEDLCMSAAGARGVQHYLLRMACNRLRMRRDFLAHPEILEQEIAAPVFICGMARTGSTKMHKLLAATGDFNWLTCWQTVNPALFTGSREESPEARIEDAESYINWMNDTSPELRLGHEYLIDEPEEELFLMQHSLRAFAMMGIFSHHTDYSRWVAGLDSMGSQLTFLRDSLKYLQWQGYAEEGKSWVLKAPFYFGFEPVIRNFFPGARLVMTHREPAEMIPSLCSFLAAVFKPISDEPFDPAVFLAGAGMGIAAHLENRQTRPDLAWLDIHYRELIDAASEVVERAYDFCGMNLSDEARQRVAQWDSSHPIHARGVHRYSLEDWGLTREQIDQQFAGYGELLENLFPASGAG